MKKITLLAAMAAVAMSASAQYEIEPGTAVMLDKVKGCTVDYVVLSESAQAEMVKAGAKMGAYLGANDVNQNLYIWPGGETFTGGDATYPNSDMETEGYLALEVNGALGWSGAGFNVGEPSEVTVNFNENTHFHAAYRTTNAPESLALLILDPSAAKIAIGANFDDGGNIYPSVAKWVDGGDWGAIDISFADLKKLYPAFDWTAAPKPYTGNILSFLAGAVTGTNFALDAVYFYTPAGDDAVIAINADNNEAVEYFNLQGVRVANPENGLYIRRQGNKAVKVVL